MPAFGLSGLQYLFDFYSRNRPVEDNQQRSVISTEELWSSSSSRITDFVGIVFEGLLPHITAESSMSEILEAYLNETNGFRDRFMYSNIRALMKIALCISVSSADAERAFSLVNNVKSKLRSCLGAPMLDALCLIASEGPAEDDFEYEERLFSSGTEKKIDE